MTVTLDEVKAKIDAAVQEDPAQGVFRGRREAFTDPEIFELEMKYIFEGNWIYLAHESQLKNNNDYLTTYIGRQPIVISRDKAGELHLMDTQSLKKLAFDDKSMMPADYGRRLTAREVENLHLRAKRPLYSALTSERAILMPSLDDALDRFFRDCEIDWKLSEDTSEPIAA